MERALTLTILIFAFCCLVNGTTPSQHWQLTHQRKPTKFTTRLPLPNKTTLITSTVNPVDKTGIQREHSYYHPAAVEKPRLIERYDKRDLDGHYEYRYVLSNGDVRYERAYWQPVGQTKILARKGYYSFPLPNHRFHTVFYTADHNGFREDESFYGRTQPSLPRSLEVPMFVSDVTSAGGGSGGGGEKPMIEKKKKINRKPNWTATILQKGRFSAIAQEVNVGSGTEKETSATTTTTTTMKTKTLETSAASSAANRPQINIKVETIPTEPTAPHTKATTATTPATSTSGLTSQSMVYTVHATTINPIKAESVQTEVMETETEQLKAVDTTTVLSVD